MKRTILLVTLLLGAAIVSTAIATAQSQSEFRMGFKTLAGLIPEIVGQPLENEHYAPNGDSQQLTTNGLMVWRKSDNWTAFTNGSKTWINGPNGLQVRSNNERFQWEGSTGTAASKEYADIFAYCAAIGNIDSPGGGYTGPSIPQAAVSSLVTLFDQNADYVSQFLTLRCYRNQPLGCLPGANLPCGKVDTSRTPNQGMVEYCKSQPDSDFIPAYITGHDTVYTWRCTGANPTIQHQWIGVDAEGFGTNFWYQIMPSEYLQETPEKRAVKAGDRFEVVLDANRTTGFQWALTWPPDESVVKLVGSTYAAPTLQPGSPPITGAGGKEIWTFEAVAPGYAAIGLSYQRPWESVQPARRHAVAVTANAN